MPPMVSMSTKDHAKARVTINVTKPTQPTTLANQTPAVTSWQHANALARHLVPSLTAPTQGASLPPMVSMSTKDYAKARVTINVTKPTTLANQTPTVTSWQHAKSLARLRLRVPVATSVTETRNNVSRATKVLSIKGAIMTTRRLLLS